MTFPWFLSMSVGFLSLSQEILWMRYLGFAMQSVPVAFSFTLMIFLLGIAMGALAGCIVCARTERLYTASGLILLVAGILDVVGPFISAAPALRFLAVPFVFLCAGLKGVIFPVAHHLGSSLVLGKTGKSVSRVYFMNITGAALGPIVTGFWLLDHVGLQTAMMCMAWLTTVLGVVCLTRENNFKITAVAGVLPVMLLGVFLQADHMIEQLACRPTAKASLHHIVETKSGIIHSAASEDSKGDYTYGGNVYDGKTNVDPRFNSNGLERVFVLAALKPEPKNILIIGLSSGAWARILTGFPGVEHIEAIEINPGYLELMRSYPHISPFLNDPRVNVTIDDGRRWLKRHPGKKFDMIVMNTTYYWRSYSSNLLSEEFLQLARAHLNSGGLLAYNATGSPDVLKTAESVFPFAFRYMNFVIASDHDFRLLLQKNQAQLWRTKMDGIPVFNRDNAQDKAFVSKVIGERFFSSEDDRLKAGRKAEIITDWNMIPEFKHGIPLSLTCR